MKFDNLSCGIFFHEVTKCGKTKWKKNSTSCKFHKDAISGRARMCEFQKYAISGRACMCEFHKYTCRKPKCPNLFFHNFKFLKLTCGKN